MFRITPTYLVRRVLPLVVVTSAVVSAHAASLGGVTSADLTVQAGPASIDIVDTVAPTIVATASPTPNASGWNRAPVTVTFTCDDEFSGVADCSSPVTVSAQSAGQTVTGTATDNAGNTATTSLTVRLDTTAPTVTIAGVSNGAVLATTPAVTCTANDTLSGLAAPCTRTITPGTGGRYDVTATATDNAGNTTTATAFYFVDTTAPTITAAVSPAPNAAGWHRTPATVTFTCTDALSGVASCPTPVTVATQTAGQTVTGTATDNAGNTATTSLTVRLDATAPTVTISGVANGAVATAVPTVTCSASDTLSGLAAPCTRTITPGTGGRYDVVATATDNAGNATTTTAFYFVLALCGTGPTNVPCVIPAGAVLTNNLDWAADVLVLGETTKKIEVTAGTVTVAAGGVVGGDIEDTGTGGVVVQAGGRVDGRIEESGDGSVSIDGVVDDKVTEEGPGDIAIGPNGVVDKKLEESGPGSVTIDGEVLDDIKEEGDGDIVVGVTGSVDGKLKESGNGSIIVSGTAGDPTVIGDDLSESDAGDLVISANATINGKIKETGAGSITVSGTVTDDATEEDDGDLVISAGGRVNGKAAEKGTGSLLVDGLVQGTADEDGSGDLTVGASGRVDGDVTEAGDGSVVFAGRATRKVTEKDAGNLEVLAGAAITTDAEESGPGNLVVTGPSSIGGRAKEANDGDLVIGADVTAAIADAGGNGVCTISPQATVATRTGSCT